MLSIDDVLLPVEEPRGDFELQRVLDNGDESLQLIRVQVSGTRNQYENNALMKVIQSAPLVEIHISLLAHQVGVSATDTLDLRQGVHDFALSIDVGVKETQDVLADTLLIVVSPAEWLNALGIADGLRERRETWWAVVCCLEVKNQSDSIQTHPLRYAIQPKIHRFRPLKSVRA